jgi:hypothetical protein
VAGCGGQKQRTHDGTFECLVRIAYGKNTISPFLTLLLVSMNLTSSYLPLLPRAAAENRTLGLLENNKSKHFSEPNNSNNDKNHLSKVHKRNSHTGFENCTIRNLVPQNEKKILREEISESRSSVRPWQSIKSLSCCAQQNGDYHWDTHSPTHLRKVIHAELSYNNNSCSVPRSRVWFPHFRSVGYYTRTFSGSLELG